MYKKNKNRQQSVVVVLFDNKMGESLNLCFICKEMYEVQNGFQKYNIEKLSTCSITKKKI